MSINLQKAEFILSAASEKGFLHDGLPQVASPAGPMWASPR